MALAGDVVLTRRRALRVFLTALIATAGLVFAAQAAHAAESVTGSATGAVSTGAISITIDDGQVTLFALYALGRVNDHCQPGHRKSRMAAVIMVQEASH